MAERNNEGFRENAPGFRERHADDWGNKMKICEKDLDDERSMLRLGKR